MLRDKKKQKICERICTFGLLMMGIGVLSLFVSVTWMPYSYFVEGLGLICVMVGGIVVAITSYFLY